MDSSPSLKTNNTQGFTLIEMVLVVGIISIIAVIGIPIYYNLQSSDGLDVTVNTLVQDLYQAQIFSRNEEDNSAWGVTIVGQTIIFYSGTSYATRNTSNESVFTTPVNIATSGLSEVDFSKLYGLPLSSGTFTLIGGGITRTVIINSEGMVDY